MMASFSYLPGQRALCLFTLATLAACGGRTSTLIDDNEPSLGSSVPSSGAGAGGSASSSPSGPGTAGASTSPSGPGTGAATGSGGAVTTPAGGAPSVGVGGATSTAGAGGSAAVAQACTDFCSKVQDSACSQEFGPEVACTSDCTSSLDGACSALGKAVLDCYLPIFTANAGHCSSVALHAQKKCGAQAQAFQDCKDANDPTPAPPPSVSCGSTGTGTALTCNSTSSCTDGSFYTVNCKQIAPDQSACTCSTAAGANTQFTLNENIDSACNDASVSCGVPTHP